MRYHVDEAASTVLYLKLELVTAALVTDCRMIFIFFENGTQKLASEPKSEFSKAAIVRF